jgi:sugar phosphate isomerase/epimerase
MLMSKPIALQLYSVRDALSADFEGTLRRVAEIGFAGVEFAGIYGDSAAQARSLCDALGLQISSAHMGMPTADNRAETVDVAATLGIGTIVCPWLQPDRFTTLGGVETVCAELNAAAALARESGLRFGYHNHDAEFTPLSDGTLPYAHMQRLLSPDVVFEIDIYWVKFAQGDPAAVLREAGARAPLVHVKDGTGRPGEAMVAVGDGVVDIPAVVGAATGAEWLIVELDNCATDMFEAVEKSFRYLVLKDLGHGR